MIQIILCIVGFFYLAKKPKLNQVSAASFPSVAPEQFEKWRSLELASIDIFLWATWGTAVLGTIIGIALAQSGPAPAGVVMLVFAVLFFGGLTASAIQGSRAAKLKSTLGIVWPPSEVRS
jgi:hypothetical protein